MCQIQIDIWNYYTKFVFVKLTVTKPLIQFLQYLLLRIAMNNIKKIKTNIQTTFKPNIKMKLDTQQKDSSTSAIKIWLIYVLTQQTTPFQYFYITFLLIEVLN
jgi:hypothetical protein